MDNLIDNFSDHGHSSSPDFVGRGILAGKGMNEKEKKNHEELFRLMKENPELPVVPMVDGELVAGDEYGYWRGSWGSVSLDEWLIAKDGEVLFKSDGDIFDALEKCLSREEFEALPEDEVDCRPAYEALPWNKAIIVYIGMPE